MTDSVVYDVLDEAIAQHRKDLQRALQRKTRALQALGKADNDISVLTGAIMALEDIGRRLGNGGATQAAPPPKPSSLISTLAGETFVDG